MDKSKTMDVLHISVAGTEKRKTSLSTERHFELLINEIYCVSFSCIPDNLEELTLGYLLSSRMVRETKDVSRIVADLDTHCIYAQCHMWEKGDYPRLADDGIRLEYGELVRRMDQFYALSCSDTVRGSHHAAVFCPDGSVHIAADIGRHNAIDKAIGRAAGEGTHLRECMLLSTGRAPTDIVEKAVWEGFPVLIFRSVPTCQAVELARQCNLTLIGCMEGNYENNTVYSGAERIR